MATTTAYTWIRMTRSDVRDVRAAIAVIAK